MREYIIRDWKAQEAADEAGAEEAEARARPAAETRLPPPPPPPPAPQQRAPEAPAAPAIAEPEDQTLGGAVRFKRFPAASASRPHEAPRPAPRGAKSGSPARKRGERRFIIAYDGVFVGFFEAAEEVTPREAFKRVAQDLAEEESFDPEKLALYKPVLLRSARPARGVNVIRGKMASLSWQPKKASIVPELQPEETAPVVEVEGA
jgi:hypothetical protein